MPADKVEATAGVAVETKAPAAAPDNSTAILAELKALREEQVAQRAAIEAQAKSPLLYRSRAFFYILVEPSFIS